MTRRPLVALATSCLVTLSVAGCANTIDTSIERDRDDSTPTTVFIATGTPDELLAQLLTEADALSEAIVDGEGQQAIMGRIDTIWLAVTPAVAAAAPQLVADFDQAIALAHRGVERRRPADADKASRNLVTLAAAVGPLGATSTVVTTA